MNKKLSPFAIELVRRLRANDYKYIARDSDNRLFVYHTRPEKCFGFWEEENFSFPFEGDHLCILNIFESGEFDFIKWEDVAPYNLERLLLEAQEVQHER